MPPKVGRVAKQVQTATRRSSRNKDLAARLHSEQERQESIDREQEEQHEQHEQEQQEQHHDSATVERNRDAIAKLSDVPLSDEQKQLRDRVMQFCRDSLRSFGQTQQPSIFLIEGDAGTGKSVVLNALFNELQRRARTDELAGPADTPNGLAGTENYLVVNHPEMLKLYHRIAAQFPFVRKTDLERPTSLINRLQKEHRVADVVLVDEAHLLLSRKNAYKRFFGDNQLEDLLRLARVLVVVFDGKQSLRFDARESVTESLGLASCRRSVGRRRLPPTRPLSGIGSKWELGRLKSLASTRGNGSKHTNAFFLFRPVRYHCHGRTLAWPIEGLQVIGPSKQSAGRCAVSYQYKD